MKREVDILKYNPQRIFAGSLAAGYNPAFFVCGFFIIKLWIYIA